MELADDVVGDAELSADDKVARLAAGLKQAVRSTVLWLMALCVLRLT